MSFFHKDENLVENDQKCESEHDDTNISVESYFRKSIHRFVEPQSSKG